MLDTSRRLMPHVTPQYLSGVMKTVLGRAVPNVDLIRLPGDASNRQYFRVVARNGSVPARRLASCVLMKVADPEAFKASEEKVSRPIRSGRPGVPATELPFLNIHRYLEACGVHVPRVLFYDLRAGLIFLEDLGDQLLETAVRGATRAIQARLYRAAITELVRLQVAGTTRPHRNSRAGRACIAFGRVFDVPLLMWEFDHFLEYGIEVRGGCRLAPTDRRRIRARFRAIAETISRLPRGLTHRDYHSRNLMVRRGKNRIWVLDFQDALLGPAQYDLASLLRDSYHTLPEGLVDELIAYYLMDRRREVEQAGARSSAGLDDPGQFRRLFDLVSIQRNLKAAGRFVYIHAVKKNSRYLASVGPTLAYVKRTLERHDDLAPLAALLRPYVPELN